MRYATYPGDVTAILTEETVLSRFFGGKPVFGPNTFGEFLRATEATYNPKTDTTRVGFTYTQPEEVTYA